MTEVLIKIIETSPLLGGVLGLLYIGHFFYKLVKGTLNQKNIDIAEGVFSNIITLLVKSSMQKKEKFIESGQWTKGVKSELADSVVESAIDIISPVNKKYLRERYYDIKGFGQSLIADSVVRLKEEYPFFKSSEMLKERDNEKKALEEGMI